MKTKINKLFDAFLIGLGTGIILTVIIFLTTIK